MGLYVKPAGFILTYSSIHLKKKKSLKVVLKKILHIYIKRAEKQVRSENLV